MDKNDPLGLMVVEHYRGDRLPQMTIAAQVVAGPDTDEGRQVIFAIAIKNPKDKAFIKRVGSHIARARLAKPFDTVPLAEVKNALPAPIKPSKVTDIQFTLACMKRYIVRWINEMDMTNLLSLVHDHYHINQTDEHKALLEGRND